MNLTLEGPSRGQSENAKCAANRNPHENLDGSLQSRARLDTPSEEHVCVINCSTGHVKDPNSMPVMKASIDIRSRKTDQRERPAVKLLIPDSAPALSEKVQGPKAPLTGGKE